MLYQRLRMGIIRFPLGLAVQGALFLILIAVILHILDRQSDFVSRTDFLWKAKLKVEQEEVETMRGINKVRAHIPILYMYTFEYFRIMQL